jgi:hypothetical protein
MFSQDFLLSFALIVFVGMPILVWGWSSRLKAARSRKLCTDAIPSAGNLPLLPISES